MQQPQINFDISQTQGVVCEECNHVHFQQVLVIRKAENKGNSKYFKQKNWLEDNEVLFSYADWFMTDKDVQASGKVSPSGRCYDWVSESLSKQSDW